MARNDIPVNALIYVTYIYNIDSNGAVQNFTYCIGNLFYLKNNQHYGTAILRQQLDYFNA